MRSTLLRLLLCSIAVCWSVIISSTSISADPVPADQGADKNTDSNAGEKTYPARNLANPYDVDVSCLLEPVVKLSHHEAIRQQVKHYNQSSHPPPASLDATWSSLPDDAPQLLAILQNPATGLLMQFIELVSFRGEGLLIGKDGGLVAATNHTTDFWQGDEPQFQQVMDSASNAPVILAAYEDASTRHVLIKIATPVLAGHGEKIGVLVIGFDEMVMQYRQLCAPPSLTEP